MTVEAETRDACSPALTALFLSGDSIGARSRAARLCDAGITVCVEVVETRQAFEDAFASRAYDFIAADYVLPDWTGMDAVAYVRANGRGTPVILISPGLDDETAAECLRGGASEYVRADRPERLAAAIKRAVRERTEGVGRFFGEERRRAAEEHCRLLLDRSMAGFFRADLDGCILDANPALARMLGFEGPGDLLGRRTSDLYAAPELRDVLLKRLDAEGSVSDAEIQLTRADGAPIWVIANVNPAGAEARVIEGTVIDITERKLAQDRTVQLNRLYSVLSHLNQAVVRTAEQDSLLRAVCRVAVEDGGFPVAWVGLLDEATGSISRVAQHGIDADPVERIQFQVSGPATQLTPLAAALRSGSDFVVNDLAARSSPDPCCDECAALGYRSCSTLPLTAGGRLAGCLTLYAAEPGLFDEQNLELLREMAEDVSFALEKIEHETERRHAEEERARLYLSEQAARAQARADSRYRELLEAAPDAILESDAEGRILMVNAAAERLFQYTRDELLAFRIEDLLTASAGAGVSLCLLRELRGLGPGQSLTARRKDASEFPVEISLSSVSGDGGELVTCIIRDVTGRKQAEAALHESNRRVASILESITDAFFALDRDWRYTYINCKAEQMLGRKRDELMGRRIWDEFPDLAGTAFDQEYRRAAAEQRPIEFTAFDAERKLWADVHVYSSEHGLSIYMQDISARKLLEERSGQSQRLEALGQLAGGVAHDFNNLLTIIGGYGQMLLDSLNARSPIRKDVEPIVEAATRASVLTRQLLAFSRRQIVQPKIVDVNRLITKMNKMLRRVIGEDVELNLALRPDLGRTNADPGQIEQVLMNLAVNARDAMPTGGRLTIATDNYEAPAEPDPAGIAPGAYILLTVTDTGSGMDENVRAHIFEPFFTTKAKGKGTGLGLSTVYGIVKQAGGDIRVDSEPGQGASFSIYLRRSRKAPKERHAAAAQRRPRKGSETILLVEDEPDVRTLAREMLVRLGYRVLEASDAAQALAVWRESGDSVDLVLTDVIMPHMSGRELAETLKAGRPGLKVLYMSGYSDEVIARHGVLHDNCAVILKPFSREALGLKVRSILDGR